MIRNWATWFINCIFAFSIFSSGISQSVSLEKKIKNFKNSPSRETWEKIKVEVDSESEIRLFYVLVEYHNAMLLRDFPNTQVFGITEAEKNYKKSVEIISGSLRTLENFPNGILCPLLKKFTQVSPLDTDLVFFAFEVSFRLEKCQTEVVDGDILNAPEIFEIYQFSEARWKK